uniref:CPSF6/7 RSLD domain-containing protein n=1 Tax=Pipistrellus kuhlii TaxID=59472 RepID=A0A7J7Y974_PIPKU|nr:hypothetical protein mPipKuh1_010333 [Pipistrellus kuhlii]
MPTSDSRGPPPTDPCGRPPPYDRGDSGPPGREMETARTPPSEAEFEGIVNENRAISSSAISRAVSDASAGDHGSAIETLIAFVQLNPRLMVLDQDVKGPERGTVVDQEKRVGVIDPAVEIVVMIIIEREAEKERDTVADIGTDSETDSTTDSVSVAESETESASIVIVRS